MRVETVTVRNILTRAGGYLRTVTSHSLQPYRGCSFGRALCGVGCYVRHNPWVAQGRSWGEFLEARENAASSYAANYERERRWARAARDAFGVFLSSSTEPFLPQEARLGVTRGVLEAMIDRPPDRLIVQTHSHGVAESAALLARLATRCEVRVHVSIETDREEVPGLPPHASSVASRQAACEELRARGLWTVVTIAPLLPIAEPDAFFARLARCADAVVVDHFIEGDGSPDGRRTFATPLPAAMERVLPGSSTLEYRAAIVAIARRHFPGRVGVGAAGFAGRFE